MTGSIGEPLEQSLVTFLEQHGYHDTTINRILYAETAPHLTKPGEKEFYEKLKLVLGEDPTVEFFGLDDYPSFSLSAADKRNMRIKFAAMNVFRVRVGGRWGAVGVGGAGMGRGGADL